MTRLLYHNTFAALQQHMLNISLQWIYTISLILPVSMLWYTYLSFIRCTSQLHYSSGCQKWILGCKHSSNQHKYYITIVFINAFFSEPFIKIHLLNFLNDSKKNVSCYDQFWDVYSYLKILHTDTLIIVWVNTFLCTKCGNCNKKTNPTLVVFSHELVA